MLPDLRNHPRILDVGCGPGAQTLVLAHRARRPVIAVDIHQPFLDELMRRAHAAGLAQYIHPICASMDALPFQPSSFDVVWSEGSIYVMGFERGLRAWQPLVRPGGYVVVSELSWLVDDPAEPARAFWNDAYPAMQSIAENRATIERTGYERLADFVLPKTAWLTDYYEPLMQRMAAFERKHRADPAALLFLAGERREIELFAAHGDNYSYVFYLMRHLEGRPGAATRSPGWRSSSSTNRRRRIRAMARPWRILRLASG